MPKGDYQLYRRGDVWWFSATVNRKRSRESTGEIDEGKARQKARVRIVELSREAPPESAKPITFGEAVGFYYLANKDERFLPKIVDELGSVALVDITPGMVRNSAKKLYPKASPATWNRQVITPIRAVVNHAADEGRCQPLRVKSFQTKKALKQAVTRAWIKSFIGAASPKLGALCYFMFTTGARIGDAVSLLWSDVNMTTKTAVVRDTKNGEDRAVHLTLSMLRMMSALDPSQRKVFQYASRHAVYGSWKRSCKKAGIEYVPPHQAGRHSFATEMIVRNGVDVATTAEAGGWKSKRLLVDTYVHGEKHRERVDEVFEIPVKRQSKRGPKG